MKEMCAGLLLFFILFINELAIKDLSIGIMMVLDLLSIQIYFIIF